MEQRLPFTAESLRMEHKYLSGELAFANANHNLASEKAVSARSERDQTGRIYSSLKRANMEQPVNMLLEREKNTYAEKHELAHQAAVEAEDAALITRKKAIEARSEYLDNILD